MNVTRPLLVTLALLAVAACRAAEPVAAPPAPAPAPEPTVATRSLGTSVEGRPIEASFFGDSGPVVLVMASIHGDEAAGTPLCEELLRRLEGAPEWAAQRRVIVLPVTNPDGLARGSRRNASGVDLNRDFPASNQRRGSGAEPTQPESRIVRDLVVNERVERILTLHQAANQVDYDGPAQGVARAMADASPLPLERMGARPGSLGSWAGLDRGVEVVTVELTRADDRRGALELWARYGAMLAAGIQHPLHDAPPGPILD